MQLTGNRQPEPDKPGILWVIPSSGTKLDRLSFCCKTLIFQAECVNLSLIQEYERNEKLASA
jgi:hypothetical protein